jgi:hypothetical protein
MECEKKVQHRFFAIGCFVAIVFCLCFASSYYSSTQLFDNYLVGIPLGMFFAAMVVNLYLLILYTLSKNTLPHIPSVPAKVFSLSIRVVFLLFIAVLVSKPLETIVYSSALAEDISEFRKEEIAKHDSLIDQHLSDQTMEIRNLLSKTETSAGSKPDTTLSGILAKEVTRTKLSKIAMAKLVDESPYFIHRISVLSEKYPNTWMITLVIAAVFFVPLVLRALVKNTTDFYDKRRELEIRLVNQAYAQFKIGYTKTFRLDHGLHIEYSEPYIDPPYNTIRKVDDRIFQSEAKLIDEIYNG